LANLTDKDLILIRQLPAATAIQGTDVIPLGQLVNSADIDSGGTIDQLVAFLSGLFNGIAVDFGPDRTAIASPEDGDIFFDTDDGIIYKYESGAWAAKLDFVTGGEMASAISGFLTQAAGDSRYTLQSALSESIGDQVATLLTAGANIAIAYNDSTNTLTLSVPNEGIDDRVAAFLVAGNNISLAYDDVTNMLTIASTVSGGGASGIQYTYSDQDPPTTSGQIRTLQADLSAATAIAIHPTDAQGNSSSDVFQRLKAGAIISIAKDGSNWIRATVTTDYFNESVEVGSVVSEGAIAVNNTVFLSIVSDAPTTSTASGGLVWVKSTTATNLLVGRGYLLDSTSLEHTLPTTAALGEEILLMGISGWSAKSAGLIYLPNNINNTGVRSASGFPRATALLRSLGGADWMVIQSEGIETYTASTSGPGAQVAENLRVAQLAASYTMSAAEITAVTNFVNSLNNAELWNGPVATTFAWYPLLGSTRAQQQINAASPATGDLINLSGTLTHNSSGFTGNGSIYADVSFMGTHWTSSNFRGVFVGFSGVTEGSSSPIFGIEGFGNTYLFGATAVSLKVHMNANEVTPTSLSSPFAGRVGVLSRASGTDVIDRGYLNGVAQPDSITGARTATPELRMLRCNSVNPPAGTTCKGFLLLKSSAGLSNANATSIDTALSTFLNAIGR
jgi:hypothetical protein